MTVIFMHDLNAAGFQDVDALVAEAINRFGGDLGGWICPQTGTMGSSQEVVAMLPDDIPPEDREMINVLVPLSEL